MYTNYIRCTCIDLKILEGKLEVFYSQIQRDASKLRITSSGDVNFLNLYNFIAA